MARSQYRIKKTLGVWTAVKNQPFQIDLPREYDYESVSFRVYGTVTLTGAGATSVKSEAPLQILRAVDIVADGRNTNHSMPFWAMVFGAYQRPNMLNEYTPVAPSGFAAGTYDYEVTGVIDFGTPDGERPKDSNFFSGALQLFQARIIPGDPADMFGGAPNVSAYTMQIEVTVSELVEIPDRETGRTPIPFVSKSSYLTLPVLSNNKNLQQNLNAGNAIKSVVLKFTTDGEPDDTLLNNVQLYAASDVRANISADALREENRSYFGNVRPGYYVLDMCRSSSQFARLSELWDVSGTPQPQIAIDSQGGAGSSVDIVTREYLVNTGNF
jgi:hypothetical protein